MSSLGKWLAGIVVLLIIGGGAWWYFTSQGTPSALPEYAPSQGTSASNGTSNDAPVNTAPQSSLQTSSSDDSDAAIEQDSANVDAQMQGLNSDNANVDQSLNDQPVPQPTQ